VNTLKRAERPEVRRILHIKRYLQKKKKFTVRGSPLTLQIFTNPVLQPAHTYTKNNKIERSLEQRQQLQLRAWDKKKKKKRKTTKKNM
jgi:hypothetical protein